MISVGHLENTLPSVLFFFLGGYLLFYLDAPGVS